MNHDLEKHGVSFRNRGRGTYFFLYREFQKQALGLDRQRDENVFQQLKSKYARELNYRLHDMAKEMMSQMDPEENSQALDHLLCSIITEFVQEFQQKIRSM